MSADPVETPAFAAHWRDPAHYRHLLDVDRAGWAWEWLRRNPGYRGVRPTAGPESLQVGRALITVVQGLDDKEGSRWGLTFRRVIGAPGDIGATCLECG